MPPWVDIHNCSWWELLNWTQGLRGVQKWKTQTVCVCVWWKDTYCKQRARKIERKRSSVQRKIGQTSLISRFRPQEAPAIHLIWLGWDCYRLQRDSLVSQRTFNELIHWMIVAGCICHRCSRCNVQVTPVAMLGLDTTLTLPKVFHTLREVFVGKGGRFLVLQYIPSVQKQPFACTTQCINEVF